MLSYRLGTVNDFHICFCLFLFSDQLICVNKEFAMLIDINIDNEFHKVVEHEILMLRSGSVMRLVIWLNH